ncbi:DUF1761 domain-containing protein [Pseudoalteromonas luteoviolacea]|uniref:DUF1761 domain-containing protein n=1 Tax=Pseudoalteromonas luteoviolacea H33 TaxID=1365251 RepID=A0A167B5P8_9GAMM|nr:DUF1761 domain-containing protein [Pseudoalteromonas luteoviolacea]KZN46175.1 hypothetical protein N476_03370 [Pseudoalteromonas luteoviolacea H33]KZN75170.1 hypothetical protein N477_20025 [Pseudoalteromonas luteoviolacea H33-S]MBQ4875815.1 DUF1761 domain-containing protein [Pseudoalteromonas luteoviolacea]MBQ4904850.1 DUF1761 domain-containing protein [Pseudoalteromonas luteoviolacea]
MYVFDINIIAVLLAALSSFLLGGIWYSPLLFQRTWLEGAGLTELDLKAANHKIIFLGSFLLSIVASVAVATLVGKGSSVIDTMSFGLFIGILFVASSFGVSYLFEQRPLKLFLVNAGYHTLQFTLIGFVIGSLN